MAYRARADGLWHGRQSRRGGSPGHRLEPGPGQGRAVRRGAETSAIGRSCEARFGKTPERLLSDILDLAKVEAGQLEIELSSFQAGDLVRSIAGLSTTVAEAKGMSLALAIDENAFRYVAGDEVRVRQVVTNLVSNAIKFTPQGWVTLTLSRTSTGAFRFSVQDTGVGFGPLEKARIFGALPAGRRHDHAHASNRSPSDEWGHVSQRLLSRMPDHSPRSNDPKSDACPCDP